MDEFPQVSIVIVNLNGAHHLPDCIRSIRKLEYPAEKVEIVVVDNGSSDGSVALLQKDFPEVRLLRNDHNEGFAKPCNEGARAAAGEFVAFLNNDMRVDRHWLSALVRSLRNGNAQCAGSLILSWDGSLIDFMGGSVGFYGYGFQTHFREPLRKMEPSLREDRELLFACGGAMIVQRQLFLDAGGFDESYFAYYEDADLGWRLRVMGCKIVLSVKSRVCHKHNGTSQTMPRPRVQYLFERNKLYSGYKNYGDELFYKAFLPALLLEIRETCLFSPMDQANYDIRNPAAFDGEPVRISQMTAIKLNALNEFVQNLPQMQEKRAFIQSRRKAADKDLLPLFTDPFIIFPKDTADFLDARYDVVKAFGIDRLFGREMPCGVAFILGDDTVRNEPYLALAGKLAESPQYEVSVAYPHGGAEIPKVKTLSCENFGAPDAVKKARIVCLCGSMGNWSKEMADAARNKFLLADASVLEDVGKTGFGTFAADCGDYFFCSGPEQHALAERVLTEAKRFFAGADPAAHLWMPGEGESAGYLDAFEAAALRFCSHPVHLPRYDAENVWEEPQVLSDGEGEGSVEDRLAHIEGLLLREHRLLQKTGETVKDVRDMSDLMERRFKKLKGRLGQIRFLKRFIKD